MRRTDWHFFTSLAVFIFVMTGIGFSLFMRQRGQIDQSLVLGEEVQNITVELGIQYDGMHKSFSSKQLTPGQTLKDLLDSVRKEGAIQLDYRLKDGEHHIYRIDNLYSDNLYSWNIYINDLRYEGDYEELVLPSEVNVDLKYEEVYSF